MKIKDLTKEEIHAMSYNDMAFNILVETKEKSKVNALFKEIAEIYELNEDQFMNQIADFFEVISTDQRFTILEGGFVDLKSRHSSKIILEADEDEEELLAEEIEEEEFNNNETQDEDIFYNADDNEVDDTDDGLEGLVVVDEDEENTL